MFPNDSDGCGESKVLSSDASDYDERTEYMNYKLKLFFFTIQAANLIVSFIMYFSAVSVDPSKSQKGSDSINVPAAFSQIPVDRTAPENIYFSIIIASQVCGVVAVAVQSTYGISLYCLIVMCSAFFGVLSTPYFIFFFRLYIDLISLYVAITIRSRLITSYTVLHLRRM